MHGRTLHGAQLDPPYEREPITYYGKKSGIGIVLQNHPKRGIPGEDLRVGLVGLGAGALAAYGRPGDYFRYYEINPDVVKLSSGPQPVFTYLRDSAARVDVELGDARLLLERELAKGEIQKFDLLVLDAFSGDAIPVHLLTREAFETYWQHLDPDHGIIAVHISSRHINLFPVLQGLIAYFHADSVIDVNVADDPFSTSYWVFLVRHTGTLNIQGLQQTPLPFEKQIPPRLWTDDYSDIFRLIQ
jgi:spermidine synthase